MKALQREIEAKNALKAHAKNVFAHILPQLDKYLNKKIFDIKGNKIKSFVIDMGDIKPYSPNDANGEYVRNHVCYLSAKYNKIELKLSICLNGGDSDKHTQYTKYKDMVYVFGECESNQVLTHIDTLENIIEWYRLNDVINLDAELAKIEEVKVLTEQIAKVKRTINIGSEYYL